MMQKLVVNQAIEAMGLKTTQLIATVFDGITRHSPEGVNFKRRAETVGWKQAVRDRDNGTWDWTENRQSPLIPSAAGDRRQPRPGRNVRGGALKRMRVRIGRLTSAVSLKSARKRTSSEV
jgi:hypothetical protein